MMASTELSVCWEDHHETQATVFKSFLDDNCLVDCTIAAEGQYLKAHKLVLSACSPYFQALFTQENEKNPIVILKDTKFEELRAIMEFVYCGHVKIPEDTLTNFLDTARSLQIKGLNGVPRNNKNVLSTLHNVDATILKEEKYKNSEKCRQDNRSSYYKENTCESVLVMDPDNQTERLENSSQNRASHLDVTNSSPMLQSSHTSLESSTSLQGVENDATNFQIASSCTVSQQDFISNKEMPSIIQTVIKREPTEVMHLEPKIECIDHTVDNESMEDITIMNDVDEMDEEEEETATSVSVHYVQKEKSQYAGFCVSYDETPPSSTNNTFLDSQTITHHSGASSAPSGFRPPPAPPAAWDPLRRLPTPEETSLLFQSASRGRARKHVCPHCHKFFLAPSQLEIHLRQHTGERPYQCGVCRAAFSQTGHLTAHMRTHTGEKPYRCDLCGDAFSESSNLKRHIRRHTGERPYRCELCGKRFTTSCQVRVHQRRWHAAEGSGGSGVFE